MWRSFAIALLALAIAAPSAAADEESPKARVAVIPAKTTFVQKEIEIPAVVKRVSTPIYETTEVPVFEERRTPRYEEREVPVYGWRSVPVYATARRAVWGTERKPVYREVSGPVFMAVRNPFRCSTCLYNLGERTSCKKVGYETKTVRKGYRTDQLAKGMKRERYVAYTKTEKVLVGHDVEMVQTGTREVKRIKGFTVEEIEVAPATTGVVEAPVHRPARVVTVVADGAEGAEPLIGTSEVVTEGELAELLKGE